MKEIKITDIENIKIGNAENEKAGTGCTVIICENGAITGLDVRGGGPASRESELTKPFASAEVIHAVLLSGGSAFGLDAAGGVMKYLEERNIGFDVGVTKVPLVCESCIFDLRVGDYKIRPDAKMGYQACVNSEKNNIQMGNYGAGAGATVGKILGIDYAMKSGLGFYALQIGNLKVGAIVSVNAFGDIFDYESGKMIAGVLNKEKNGFGNSEEELIKIAENKNLSFDIENNITANTTIGAVITNAKFTKSQMEKIASMSHNGFARTIKPVHTTLDGDSIYAMSVGDVKANLDAVGSIAAIVMGKAINSAIVNTKSAYGFKAYNDLINFNAI
ncbi:peptidase S58 family protein [Brachyspira aalborgi]|uniref:Peptidase S58 family protein n=1 Tax=Brachyspira aalborgi TaxID=29522 RepID=A0A5C8GFF4_9SPIR|nr:P1 family peptidase [Brachyspira aalborgi]TXJ60008.1 peptidase S58 family protein [Brachyspira aalborgi]